MILKKINKSFTVCKVKNINEIDFSDEYCFFGKTDESFLWYVQREKLRKTALRERTAGRPSE